MPFTSSTTLPLLSMVRTVAATVVSRKTGGGGDSESERRETPAAKYEEYMDGVGKIVLLRLEENMDLEGPQVYKTIDDTFKQHCAVETGRKCERTE